MRRLGVSSAKLKELSFAIRREMLTKVMEDLQVQADPHAALLDGLAWGFSGPPSLNDESLDPKGIELLSHLTLSDGSRASSLFGKPVGILFSGSWCGPCKQFLPHLVKAYENLRAQNKDFEIVFVSADKNQEEFDAYFAKMPWLAVPFSDEKPRSELSQLFGVKGIPTLVILSKEGKLITKAGRQAVLSDPECKAWPWDPLSVAAVATIKPLTRTEAQLISMGCKSLALAAVKETEAERRGSAFLAETQNLIERIQDLSERLGGGRAGQPPALPDPLEAGLRAPLVPFSRFALLNRADDSSYAGNASSTTTPQLTNMLEVPSRVETAAEAILAMSKCLEICGGLLNRAMDGSTSSRISIQ